MSTINERIAACIEQSGLTKTAFAERINISQPHVSRLAKDGTPSDRTIADICREFNVSEPWLRTGEGPMFIELDDDDEFTKVITEIQVSNDDFVKKMLKAYWRLPEEKKAVIRELVDGLNK